MLIRIAPNIFLDDGFDCCTVPLIRNEIVRNSEFKKKYPWINDFKQNITCLPTNICESAEVALYFDTINTMVSKDIIINSKTGRPFDLSYVDQKFLACALANKYQMTTGDVNLKNFASQEFVEEYKGDISPLGMINKWITQEKIEWNDALHGYLGDWEANAEHPQPKKQKSKFKELTGRKYPGS
jgi:hypothetical protein